MKILESITEDQFIAVFLKNEITSARFGDKIKKQLEHDKKDQTIITQPNIKSFADNVYRARLLGLTRGYGKNKALFENFPDNVVWKEALIDRDDLQRVKYINYDYWVELSGGTRYPKDAAVAINKGVEIFGQSNSRFYNAANYLKNGGSFLDMIFVCKNPNNELVVLEGHLRITAYFMAPEFITNQIKCIIGISEDLDKWDLY